MKCNLIEPDTDGGGFIGWYGNENKYSCMSNYILLLSKTTARCVKAGTCTRRQVTVGGQVCYERVCPEDLAYDEHEELCVEDCGGRPKFRPDDETLC